MTSCTSIGACTVGCLLCVAVCAHAGGNLIANQSFEAGDDAPARWQLSEPPGQWEQTGRTGQRSVSVEGTEPGQNNYWYQQDIPVDPFSTYRFAFHARTSPDASGGCIISGPDFCNRDVQAGREWTRLSHVFITKPDQSRMRVRLGHWHKVGKVFFDDVSVQPVLPVHRHADDIALGDGERIRDGKYEFSGPFGEQGANYCRALQAFSAGFNSNRWVFGPGSYVTYCHEVAAAQQTAATVSVSIGYYRSGECIIQAGTDGEEFVTIGRLAEDGTAELKIPARLLPAQRIYVRMLSPAEDKLAGDQQPGSFQVRSYEYSAELDSPLADVRGETSYLDLIDTDPKLAVTIEDLGDMLPGEKNNIARLLIKNNRDTRQTIQATISVLPAPDENAAAEVQIATAELPPAAERPMAVPYDVPDAGHYILTVRVAAEEAEAAFAASTAFSVPALYATGYGYPVGGDAAADVWWCEGTYKVSRARPAPRSDDSAIQPVKIAAARNEYEPCQIVLRPTTTITGLAADVSDLTGPGGNALDADNVDICYVWYHYVQRPTDGAGCVGWWPDALPPLDEPIDLQPGKNQPLWVTVHVPSGTPPGDYLGTIHLSADNWSFDVPLQLHVWDFELPQRSSISGAFGLSPGRIWQYHNITDAEDRRKVWDLYMQNFRDHRVAPYQFWLQDMQVQFSGFHWTGGQIDNEDPYAGESCIKVADDSEDRSVDARAANRIDLDPQAEYLLTFAAKTAEPDQGYMVTMQTYDDAGQWISGHNIDLRFTGSGEWEKEQFRFTLAQRSPDARSVLLVLRPALWTESGENTGTAWFDDIALVKNGTDENLVPGGGFEGATGDVTADIDFEQWDAYARKYIDEYGFNAFRLHLRGMGGGTFHSRHYGRIGPYTQGTPGYRTVFGEYCMKLQNHLQENGWLDEAYVYWFDEPAPKDYEFVKEGMGEIQRAAPELRRMLTEEPVEELHDAVDIWCPVLHRYDAEACHERQQAGDTIWWYVCTGPKAPYPGLFIDHNAVDMRIWLWMSHKWNVEGVLVWSTNYWTSPCAFPDTLQNPWQDPMGYVSGYGRPPGFIGYWGNGDGRFLYPPNRNPNTDDTEYLTGPVNSIRWEMLREGVEDFEYFKLLAQLVEQRGDCPQRQLLQIPQEIVNSRTEFTHDPLPMYEHRRKVARAIEELRK